MLLASSSIVPAFQTPENDAAQKLVSQALAEGSYAEAERQALVWCARVEAEHGPESLALAQALDWLVEAQLRNGKAALPATLALAERVASLKERHVGRDHPDTATSLHNLGMAHALRGEFTAALQRHERALAIRSASLGPDDASVADSLDQSALALIQLERFQEAKEKLDRSRRIREDRAAESPLALSRTLEAVGMLHRYAGSFAEAVRPLDRALAVRTRLAPEHPETASLLQVRGDVFFLMGDSAGAQTAWSQALAIGERTLGPDHPAIAEFLRRLGISAFSLGNLHEARRWRERALQIGERSLAPCDPSVTALLNAFAMSLQYDGDYSEARKLYRRALEIVRGCRSAGHAGITAGQEGTYVFNDADVAREVGDLQAEHLYERAVQIWSKGLGPDHPFVARGLDSLAEVVASRGQLTRAHALYERALTIRRRALGADHPQVAWTLTNLARTVADRGNLPLALRYVDQAIAIYKKSGASDEPDHFARVLELRGTLEARRGNIRLARTSLSEALSERERIFGLTHPLTAATRAASAYIDFARGAPGAALVAALEAEQAGLAHLRFTVRYLPERQAMAYAAKRPRGLDLALSIAASGAVSNPAQLLDTVIRSRGTILDELAARSRSVDESDPKIAALNARATGARQRFANLVVRSFQEVVPRALLDEARQHKEEAERELAEHSAETRAELLRASTGVEGIRRALPPDSVLVSFVRYDRTLAPAGGQPLQPAPSYAAFVIGARSPEAAFVQLGTAATLDGLVKAWREEAAGRSFAANRSAARAERSYLSAAGRLREAVWDPLIPLTAGAARIFIVPDGLLNVVSFAALPEDDGRYLAEGTSVIHYLSTERDLVVTERSVAAPQMLLAVGGPTFDEGAIASISKSTALRAGCQQLARLRFDHLPGSLDEVTEISKLWPAGSANEVTVLTGDLANETAVKQSLVGRRVVHLATHGFFLGADCTVAPAGTRAVGGVVAGSSTPAARTLAENPLLLAGLALAGANRRRSATLDEDEGILTADEIAGLNLQGTDWAVLSACDTGLGEIRAGEGVFGLRRAFQIAGARTVIMSLWSVEDRSAMVWMRKLYEGRLQNNLNTADAIHAANLAALRDRRAKSQTTHPFYWAGFVAAGDWR
jgi:CHAT domain-containing protein/tetratricopeptide (TPR) repeat protein